MFVSVVSSEVAGDHVPPAGAVGTGGALVRLLPRVSPLVGGEMVRPAEDLAAHLAAVGLVAGVESHMTGEHVTPGEGSLADLAEVGSAASANTRVSGARLSTATVNRFVQIIISIQSFASANIWTESKLNTKSLKVQKRPKRILIHV